MRNVLLVAKREYLEQVRGHAFIISTMMLPILIVAMLTWTYIVGKDGTIGKHMVIIADNAGLAGLTRQEFLNSTKGKFTVDIITPLAPENLADLRKQVLAKSIDGILAISISPEGKIISTLTTRSSDELDLSKTEEALNTAIARERMANRGIQPTEIDSILNKTSVESLVINKNGKIQKREKKGSILKPLLMIFLLSVPVMLYGLDMARAIVEEKNSRIYEVMLSVASADDVLAGKLLGVGAIGLTQILIWGIAFALFMGPSLFTSWPANNVSVHFTLAEVLMFPVYFVLDFAIFSALFSGLAAACETSQDLQKFMSIAVIPLYVSMGVLPMLLKDPNANWAIATSLFPLTSPYVMISRMGVETVPPWQIVASVALLIAGIWITLWLSSRFYRIGILMYGKRITLPELFAWLRYS